MAQIYSKEASGVSSLSSNSASERRRVGVPCGAQAPAAYATSSSVDVSIVVAARNAEASIGESLRSALAQTGVGLEVIVVDDASTDSTAAIVEDLARSDPRIIPIRSDERGGPAVARNLALRHAKGTWVAVLDADDWFHPDRLHALLAVAHEQDADMVADNLWLVDSGSDRPFDTMLRRRSFPTDERITIERFVRNNRPNDVKRKYGLLKPIIRRRFIEQHALGYDEKVFYGEDFLLYFDCLLRGARFVLIPDAYYFYRVSRFSTTGTRTPTQAQNFLERCDLLLEREEVQASPDLAAALRERSVLLRRDLVYLRFMSALKAGCLREMLHVLVAKPGEGPRILRHLLATMMLRSRQKLKPFA